MSHFQFRIHHISMSMHSLPCIICILIVARAHQRAYATALASTPPGLPGTHPPNILVGGDVNGNIPPILLHTFGYSRPLLVALRSLSLKPISFGYKTPPIRFSQAGGQSAHEARPPNLQLALTPLCDSVACIARCSVVCSSINWTNWASTRKIY